MKKTPIVLRRKRLLCLQQVADDLLPVLVVASVADMHPVRASLAVLPDELVEVAMRLNPCEPPAAFRLVAVDAKVCCLAIQVLTVRDSANGLIKARTAIAASYLHLVPHRIAERLQHMMHQCTQVRHLLRAGHIMDALGLCRRAGGQFLQCKVLTDSCCHHCLLSCFALF